MLRIVLIIALCSGFQTLTGQTSDIDKEALSFLTSEKKVNVIFTYVDLSYNAQQLSEEEFLKEVSSKINNPTNNEMAEKWSAEFKEAKTKDWPELFITTMNRRLWKNYDKAPSFVLHDTSTSYLMVINTNWMDFDYDARAVRGRAKANMTIYFYDNSDPLNPISAIKFHPAESGYKNSEFQKPSLSSMKGVYKQMAEDLSRSLRRVVR